MTQRTKQIIFLIWFFGLLGSLYFLRDQIPGTTANELRLERADAIKRYDFCLEEVSQQCGIRFTHHAPTKLDRQLDHIMPIIASMGASVAVADFNRDGLPDLFVVNSGEGSKCALYRNKGDGTFEDVAEQMGLADLNRLGDGICMGAVWGDYDNDGYEDLLVYRWGRPELFHNDKGKGFTRVTDHAGLPRWVNANSAVWLDYDGDGKLDLFIAGYWADDVDLWNLKTTSIMPTSFQFANNGGSKFLLRNKGDGTFEDVTEKVGITSKRWTLAVAATDLRGTGYPDIVLANDYGVNEYFANDRGQRFVEIGKQNGIGDLSKSGMSASFGDVFNQGRFAIYISNITEPSILQQWNNLWVPDPKQDGEFPHYQNLAPQMGVALGGWSWGAQFGDLNNDGRVDLFLTNGYISGDRNRTYWHDYSMIAGALLISEAKKWPPIGDRSLGGYQANCLWLNKGGTFHDIAKAVGVTESKDGRAVALVDLWNRGALDVVLATQKGPLLVYKNHVTPENDWIQFELEGTRSNKSAIGAQVTLYWNDQVQIQEVSGGSGYASQNQRRLHFGLGKNAKTHHAEIRWPGGRTQTVTAPQSRQLHKIVEPK
jgi:enediyne biosynthesis protein E4